jgi:hypothetical protein
MGQIQGSTAPVMDSNEGKIFALIEEQCVVTSEKSSACGANGLDMSAAHSLQCHQFVSLAGLAHE